MVVSRERRRRRRVVSHQKKKKKKKRATHSASSASSLHNDARVAVVAPQTNRGGAPPWLTLSLARSLSPLRCDPSMRCDPSILRSESLHSKGSDPFAQRGGRLWVRVNVSVSDADER